MYNIKCGGRDEKPTTKEEIKMICVNLPLSKIKEKLVAYGLTKTSSESSIRYEGNLNNTCVVVGVEIISYNNIYKLLIYAYGCFNHNYYIDYVENELKQVFKEEIIEIK